MPMSISGPPLHGAPASDFCALRALLCELKRKRERGAAMPNKYLYLDNSDETPTGISEGCERDPPWTGEALKFFMGFLLALLLY